MAWEPASENDWRQMLALRPAAGGLYTALTVVTSPSRVLISVDSQGRRQLLIESSPIGAAAQQLSTRAIRVSEMQLEGAEGGQFLALRLEGSGLEQLFGVICEEIVARVRGSEGTPFEVVRRVLDGWRALLMQVQSGLMPLEAQLGLFAELQFLCQLARISDDPVAAWMGPAAGRHDFVGSGGAVEVKAVAGSPPFRATINGLKQLEPQASGALILWALPLERSPQGISLTDAVAGAVKACGASPELEARLLAAGYRTADEDQYRRTRFVPGKPLAFLVGEAFPRLVRQTLHGAALHPAIERVTYSINLSDSSLVPMTSGATAASLKAIFGSADAEA